MRCWSFDGDHGNIVVDDPAATFLHVDAFGGRIGGQQQPHGGGRVLKLGLDRLEVIEVHAAVQEPQRVLVEALLQEPLFQEEQRLLVFGEDEQPFVVPQLAVDEQVLLDPLDQGFGLGIGLAGQCGELASVLGHLSAKPESFQGLVDFLQRFLVRSALAAEPSPGIAGSVLFKGRPFVVALGLLFGPFCRNTGHVEERGVLGVVRFLQVPPPSSGKGIGARQEPLGQQGIDELAHPSFRCRSVAQGGMALLPVLPQCSEQRRFLVRHADGDFHGIKLFSERWPKGLLVDVVLEAANADFGQIVLVLGVHFRVHLEPDRIEQFQQAGEGNGLAVVGRGRGEEAMLEQEPDFPQHPGTLACTPAALRGEMVALVHDQQVPRGVGHRAAIGFGIGADTGCLEELLQHVGHSQVVHRRDDPWEMPSTGSCRCPCDGEAGRWSRSR